MSSDVSGGVDSATIAFTLNKLIPDFSILHSESSTTANSDTKWATFIAKNLGRELNKFDSIEKTEKRFSVDENISMILFQVLHYCGRIQKDI